MEWFQQPGSLMGAHQCVQGAGDLLFVPNMWAHAVLNVEDVVATATFTMTNNGESSEKLCTMRRGQDAAAAAVSFAEVHQVNAEGLLQIAQHMAGLTIAGYEPPKVSE